MVDDNAHELILTMVAVVVCGIILALLTLFYPDLAKFFSQFAETRHGQF